MWWANFSTLPYREERGLCLFLYVSDYCSTSTEPGRSFSYVQLLFVSGRGAQWPDMMSVDEYGLCLILSGLSRYHKQFGCSRTRRDSVISSVLLPFRRFRSLLCLYRTYSLGHRNFQTAWERFIACGLVKPLIQKASTTQTHWISLVTVILASQSPPCVQQDHEHFSDKTRTRLWQIDSAR